MVEYEGFLGSNIERNVTEFAPRNVLTIIACCNSTFDKRVFIHRMGKARERELFIGNRMVRIHFVIVMIRWTGPAPWECEFHFSGSLTSTFLALERPTPSRLQVQGGEGRIYELGKILGGGAFGVVREGTLQSTGKRVCLS